MNTKFVRLVLVVLASLSLAGCFETLGRRPAGYTHQGGYLIPPGQSAEEQLVWVNQEEAVRCGPDARRLDIITGVVIGAAAGAVIASRGSRATGAVLGGLGGGAIGTMSVGDYCSTLQRSRGLIQAHITAQLPVETLRCKQVFDSRTGKWFIPAGGCQRDVQQQQVLPARPSYVPR
ncbi:MAG: hypothetical protein KA054_03055 [Candidatus Moranbacteria bacterium]|nr:hypothetical protein [Candidatus Moranbacteria bacterium]MDQ5976929.1 hypothetical protein [Patescibacteria group bacterium]